MKQVKIFKFEVSNTARVPMSEDIGRPFYERAKRKLYSPEMIETVINEFVENFDCNVIDIKVNEVECHYHNNARGNTVELWYTIIYEVNNEKRND